MKREIETLINEWLNNSNKALLIEGARQVGKTYTIREVLRKDKNSYFEINFIDRPDILKSLQNTTDCESFVEKLKLFSPNKLEEKKSIIFFDEIQEFPEIITKIKFLIDNGAFKYILSGSLLGVELTGIKSMPVGYIQIAEMYPMSFWEFTRALNVSDNTINYIHKCYDEQKEVDEIIHKKLLDLFYTYLIVGGMPSVVNNFLKTKNLYEIDLEQKNIISQYKLDFTKYEHNDKKLRIISIYNNIPSQLNKQNMKFVFSYLNKELKFDRYENSFLWLKEAGVALPVFDVTNVESPLIISKEKNDFKLFLSDVGLLTSYYPFSVREQLITHLDNKYNNGALFENFVCQELRASGFEVFYFKGSKIGEIDFLIEVDGIVNAIEVKSGKYRTTHKALDNLIKIKSDVKPIVFSTDNVGEKDGILYLPIYMIGYVKNYINTNSVINIDLTSL